MSFWENWKICYVFTCFNPQVELSIIINCLGVPSVEIIKREIAESKPDYEEYLYSFKLISHQRV